jgi:dihydroneopterin aldolase
MVPLKPTKSSKHRLTLSGGSAKWDQIMSGKQQSLIERMAEPIARLVLIFRFQ